MVNFVGINGHQLDGILGVPKYSQPPHFLAWDFIICQSGLPVIDCFKEKLQEKSHDLHGRIGLVSCRFSLKSTHWSKDSKTREIEHLISQQAQMDICDPRMVLWRASFVSILKTMCRGPKWPVQQSFLQERGGVLSPQLSVVGRERFGAMGMILFPIKGGAVRSYQEFPNHILVMTSDIRWWNVIYYWVNEMTT